MPHQPTQLRILICEDEYLLASDLAAELAERGVRVEGILAKVSDILEAVGRDDFAANAAAVDVQLLDGMAYPAVRPLLDKGVAVVLCTGHHPDDLPAECAGLPSVGKPTDVDRLLRAFAACFEDRADAGRGEAQ